MTQKQHPITPPDELVMEWRNKHYGGDVQRDLGGVERTIATQAARWGADQELKACRNLLRHEDRVGCRLTADWLHEARRPNPPSLKEQALAALEKQFMKSDERDIIRRALEALPD